MTATGPDRPDLRLGQPGGVPSSGRRPGPTRAARVVGVALLVLTLVAAVGILGYQWGERRRSADVAAPSPSTSGTGRFSAAGSASPSTQAPTTAPQPRLVGTLITKNLGSDQYPNRVYNAVGQGGTTAPRFVVRTGERLRIKVVNRDNVVHTFTADAARTNVEVFAHSGETATFQAPRRPGTYSFYCRYRQVGMNGTLVVRKST